jgi:RHS repeat-associated protein
VGAAYGYDNDYRLTSEAITGDPAGNNGSVSYTQYDAVGNRLQMTSTLNAVPGGSFNYDANDRLTTDVYDNNGNTISFAGISNTYDFENRMLTRGAVSIVYDGDGIRVSETIGGTTTKFLMDDHNPTGLPQVLDEIVSGAVTRTYAYGLQRISENQLISSTWTPSFYGYDGHGNTRFLASTSGTLTDTYQYDAFGMPVASSGATANNFRYSGEWLESNLSLYYLRARHYNQATGRFGARDPYEGAACSPLTFNPYIYALDNPVDNVDPTGEQAIIEYLLLYKWIQGFTPKPRLSLCSVRVGCSAVNGAKGYSHCTVTTCVNGSCTAYDGGPSGNILLSTLIVTWGPTTNQAGPNTIFDMPVPCGTVGCIQQTAYGINQAHLPYNFLLLNSNTAAAKMTKNCGLNVSYPSNAVGAGGVEGP